MKKFLRRALALSLLALSVPAYALAAKIDGMYAHEGSAQFSYATLQLKTLHTAGREPIVFAQIKGAVGSESSQPKDFLFSTSLYEDNEKSGIYYASIPDLGSVTLKLTSDPQKANLAVTGSLPAFCNANYDFAHVDLDFSKEAVIKLLEDAPPMLTSLKGDYQWNVQDKDSNWLLEAKVGEQKISSFDVSKDLKSILRTDTEEPIAVYTSEPSDVANSESDNKVEPSAQAFSPDATEGYLKDFLSTKSPYGDMLKDGCELRKLDFDSGAALWQVYYALGQEKPSDGFVIYEKFAVAEDKKIFRLTREGYKQIN